MDIFLGTDDTSVSEYPSISGELPRVQLEARQQLVFPNFKRVFHQYITDSFGTTELHLWFGDKEIIFDEADLFEFGEQLIKQRNFAAFQAMQWGPGYEWPRVRDLLQQLIDEGVLFRADDLESVEHACSVEDATATLPPAPCQSPRTWFECESITRELTGQAVEVGYLEMIMPIFRVAHIAMDSEGRQVGEANVFPKALRVDFAIDWRLCRHAGSRYLNEKPMNVSAMKAMRKHWPQMMAVLTRIRGAFLERFPNIAGAWTVGDLERLTSVVLALPAYLLMRNDERVQNGQLHPVFSNVFRVTDGVRLTMHQMLFLPTMEPTLPADAPMTSAEIYAFVERNNGFVAEHGVCAGPRIMIEEFLSILVDGKSFETYESEPLDPEVANGLEKLQDAIDYGLYGLQIYAQVFSHWPATARAYERLWSVLEQWGDQRSGFFVGFRDRFELYVEFLRKRTLLRDDDWRDNRDLAYANMYLNATLGLGKGDGAQPLADRIAPRADQYNIRENDRLRAILSRRLFGMASAVSLDLDRFVGALMDFLHIEQAIVRAACSAQQSINELLGRAAPARPFDAAEFDIYVQFQGDAERLPGLIQLLEQEFEMDIVVTHERIEFSERPTTA